MKAVRRDWIVPALALLGLADALYLAVLHWQGEVPPCHGYAGCAQVNTSPYAEIFGVPVAALGAALYATVLGIAVWRPQTRGVAFAQTTLLLYSLILAGALFMAYLTAIEAFVLQAYCYWCLGLATINLLLLVLVSRELWLIGGRPARYQVGRA